MKWMIANNSEFSIHPANGCITLPIKQIQPKKMIYFSQSTQSINVFNKYTSLSFEIKFN